jgi:hypothetical protein
VAGEKGARCFFFPYEALRTIPYQSIIEIVEVGGFMRRKEGLMHVLCQKYNFEVAEAVRY